MTAPWEYLSDDEEERTRAWARRYLDPSAPRYGTDAWHALPDDDPRRFAALVLAADCWREHTSRRVTAARLSAEMAEADRAAVARVRGASADVAATKVVPLGLAALHRAQRQRGGRP